MDASRLVLISIVVATQLAVFSTETLGGVSGQDSIVRSNIASLDISGGLIFLNGAYEFLFNPRRGTWVHLPRFRLIHARQDDITQELQITTRTRWLPIFAPSKRLGTIKEKTARGWEPESFTSSLNQFIVPYMRYSRIPENQAKTVTLSRATVHSACALSVSRYICFFVTSLVVLCIRGFVYWKFTPQVGLRYVVFLSELGRWIAVFTQVGSVLTYSCHHKGVATWFSPVITGPRWDVATQEEFRRLVWEGMGYAWHAKAVFWMVEQTYCFWTQRSAFATFRSPTAEEYISDVGELQLEVYDEEAPFPAKKTPLYTVHYRNVPRMMRAVMGSVLVGALQQKLCFGAPAFFLGICGIVSPVLFVYFNPSSLLARYFWLVEQVVINALKYYDWEDWSVNTSFERLSAHEVQDQELSSFDVTANRVSRSHESGQRLSTDSRPPVRTRYVMHGARITDNNEFPKPVDTQSLSTGRISHDSIKDSRVLDETNEQDIALERIDDIDNNLEGSASYRF